jgi:hypothetical protein
MTLEMLVGAVGIIVAAITFIGGMLTFAALDRSSVASDQRSDSAPSSSSRVR